MPFDPDKAAQKAVNQCVKWMQRAAESQPVRDPGKWKIGDELFGRSDNGEHKPPYSQFLSSFKEQLQNDKNAFKKAKGNLKRLSRHIGIHARFLAEAAHPKDKTISRDDLLEAVTVAKQKCTLLMRIAGSRRDGQDKPFKILDIWCRDVPGGRRKIKRP